jgi:hypothetical protein
MKDKLLNTVFLLSFVFTYVWLVDISTCTVIIFSFGNTLQKKYCSVAYRYSVRINYLHPIISIAYVRKMAGCSAHGISVNVKDYHRTKDIGTIDNYNITIGIYPRISTNQRMTTQSLQMNNFSETAGCQPRLVAWCISFFFCLYAFEL